MRKLITITAAALLSGIAHAGTENGKLFDCMNGKTFELNSQCLSSRIAENNKFRSVQTDIIKSAEQSSDNVLATLKFYPKYNLIEVIAQRDALSANRLQKLTTLAKN